MRPAGDEVSFMLGLKKVYCGTCTTNLTMAQMIRTEYTFHEGLLQDAYHVDLMRKNMTEKLSSLLPDIVDEITDAFEELTDIKNGELLVPISTLEGSKVLLWLTL